MLPPESSVITTTRQRRARRSIRGFGSAAAPSTENRYLLLTSKEWMLAASVGLGLAAVLWPFYHNLSPSVAGALFLAGVIVVHLRYAARFIIPFPHMAIMVAALQYVFAAWASAYWPPADPLFDIGSGLSRYLPYGTLVLLACCIGWGLGLSGLRPPANRPGRRAAPGLMAALDGMLVLGFLGVVPARMTQGTSYGFLFVLIANLLYLGVFGRMALGGWGWGWRLALVALVQLFFSTNSGMFHTLVLLGLWSFACLVYFREPSWTRIVAGLLGGLLLLPALQASKLSVRKGSGDSEGMETRSALGNAWLWSSSMGENLGQTLSGRLDAPFLGDTCARYNQGWIVNRVMQYVPSTEPYAHGTTVRDAVISALVPRLFYPDKVITGGRVNMARFANVEMTEETSMNLGYAGEMYANFGYWGGIIGCGLYCLVFALLFRWICVRAFISPLWWGVLPFVCFVALKAEDDIVGVVNWTVKAFVVLAGLCFVSPAIRQSLFPPRQPGRRRPHHRPRPHPQPNPSSVPSS
jgi:hypothetical protein